MRIVITGGAGFIGSHLVDRLLKARVGEIIVLDNFAKGTTDNLRFLTGEVTVFQSDICHAPLDRILRNVDLVYHLAGVTNVRTAMADPAACLSNNVSGTVNVLHAAYRVGVRHIVLASSREVYGDAQSLPVCEDAPLNPKNVYGASKVAAEYCCMGSAVPKTIVRIANVYGTRDCGRVVPMFIENALADRPLMIFGGDQIVDFIKVECVAEALLRAGLGPPQNGPVNIGSGHGITIEALARRIVELTRSRSRLHFLPQNAAEVTRFVANTSRASLSLGLPAIADPLDGLPEVIEFIREKRAARMRAEFLSFSPEAAPQADSPARHD